MEKGIITVVGKDRVGIIANVCTFLAQENINILDITQTIVQGYFNMIMIVDITHCQEDFMVVVEKIKAIGKDMNVDIKLQHENIFNQMHRL